MEDAAVFGGSGSGKDGVVNAGDLLAEDIRASGCAAGVRVAIVASKSGNADGAKGDRKVNASKEGLGEGKLPSVPARDKQGREEPWPSYGAERRVWTEKMLATLHREGEGKKWFSLIDKVSRLDVLQLAWAKVQSNAGACGVDGITVEDFAKDSLERLLAVKKHLEEGSYQAKPVKRVWINKLGSRGEKRPLGIPTVRDRVVETALKMVIEPIFERGFAEDSYGFRSGRGCKDALGRVDELLQSGHVHVVDIDIKGYFDAIDREKLMGLVAEKIADGRVLELVGEFLKQKVMDGMASWEPESGTPQGAVISPLLANIYLNPLDWLLGEAGLEMVRYADDLVVLCRHPQEAEQALEQVRSWMTEAGLELHPQKTRIVAMSEVGHHFDFLGYRFWRGKGGRIRRYVRPKSKKKMQESIKPHTKRCSGKGMPAIIAKINPMLKGWYGYFRHVSKGILDGIDGWVRGRLRSILRKRSKRKGRSRGLDHTTWSNRYFDELGLFCLEQARCSELAGLR